MSDDLPLDFRLTDAQLRDGHEFEVTFTRRVLREGRMVLADETAKVKTPPGIEALTVMRMQGLGHVSRDGTAGNLLLRLVSGDVVGQELRLSAFEVQRGVRRTVVTAVGRRFELEVPAGLESGMALQRDGVHFRVVVDVLLESEVARVRPRSWAGQSKGVVVAVLIALGLAAWVLLKLVVR